MATAEEARKFIETIAPRIKAEAERRGYKVASPIIAQACIESGYGTSSLAYKYHNYFGMKCGSSWKGASVNLKTKEEYNSQLVSIRDNFRVYSSMEDGVVGYFNFINTKRYANLKTAETPRQYLEFIKADGYATSSSYVNTCMTAVEKWGLTKYDNVVTYKPITPDIINKVIRLEFGTGSSRAAALRANGYDPEEVQKKVNEVYKLAKELKPFKDKCGEYFECVCLFDV